MERIVQTALISSRKNAFGEWVVRAYDQHGERWPEADYFTPDRDDAEQTAITMIQNKGK